MTLVNLASCTLLAEKIDLLNQMKTAIDSATVTSIEIKLWTTIK